jgi:hypothetical protein
MKTILNINIQLEVPSLPSHQSIYRVANAVEKAVSEGYCVEQAVKEGAAEEWQAHYDTLLTPRNLRGEHLRKQFAAVEKNGVSYTSELPRRRGEW